MSGGGTETSAGGEAAPGGGDKKKVGKIMTALKIITFSRDCC